MALLLHVLSLLPPPCGGRVAAALAGGMVTLLFVLLLPCCSTLDPPAECQLGGPAPGEARRWRRPVRGEYM